MPILAVDYTNIDALVLARQCVIAGTTALTPAKPPTFFGTNGDHLGQSAVMRVRLRFLVHCTALIGGMGGEVSCPTNADPFQELSDSQKGMKGHNPFECLTVAASSTISGPT
jgi:hypothetical protein